MTIEMSAEEFREKYLGERRPNKYNAKPTVSGGVRYDSKYEAEIARHLAASVRAGLLKWVLRQVPVRLGEDHMTRVDFVVQDKHGDVYAIEAKGADTPAWNRTMKLWRKYGPFPMDVERRNREPQWILPEPT